MFAVLELPLADAREFVEEDTRSLTGFFAPPVNRSSDKKFSFARSFGEIQERKKGGMSNWDSEEFFGISKRAFRFEPFLGNQLLGPSYSQTSIKEVWRNLFYNKTTAHLEIGFEFLQEPQDGEAFRQTLIDLLNLKVRVPHIDSERKRCVSTREMEKPLKAKAIKDISSSVALRLLYSTTKHNHQPKQWWITAAAQFFFVQLDIINISQLPKEARLAYKFKCGNREIDLYYLKLFLSTDRKSPDYKKWIDVWILCGDSDDTKINEFLREIRLNISRYITERECLQVFIYHINQERIVFREHSLRGQALQDYLEFSLNLIEKGKGLEFSNLSKGKRSDLLLKIVHFYDNSLHPGDYLTLLTNLQKVHRNLLYQVSRVLPEQKISYGDIYIFDNSEGKTMTKINIGTMNEGSNLISESTVEGGIGNRTINSIPNDDSIVRDIRALLVSVEKQFPEKTVASSLSIAAASVQSVENDPTLKQRLIAALQHGGSKAFEKALNHPAASFFVGACEGFKAGK